MNALAIALAALAAALAARLAYHAWHVWTLRRWLRRPALDTLPVGRGTWEDLLADLHRYLKRRDGEADGLQQALARFRAATQALPDGVVILDSALHIEWSNGTAAAHFGIDARRDFGQLVTHFVRHPDFIAYLERGDYREPLTLRVARADLGGQLRALQVRVIEFGEEQKLLNSRDVTVEERVDTMRRDFVANVSHELKTPVTVLSGFVETLADESLELAPAQRKRFLGLMADQARRMQQLVEDLLTLSALESSETPDVEQPIELRPFVEQLGEEARALSAGRHRVEVAIGADCQLTGDAKELHSALSNLVSNAVRYTPQGGAVRLAWRLQDGRGVFSVSDTGIGIEQRHVPRLTERFYRVDTSRSRETGGTGLGLAIVKHVLTRHQAVLEIESELGRGSTFSAVFPAERVHPSPARVAAQAAIS